MKRNNLTNVIVYPSLAAMQDHAMGEFKLPTNRTIANKTVFKPSCEGADWYGEDCRNYAAAKVVLEHGATSCVDWLDSTSTAMAATLPRAIGIRRKRTRAPNGGELDIHYVLRGNLSQAFESFTPSLQRGTALVRIVADVGGNAHRQASELRLSGMAAIVLDRLLVKAGYSCEIVAGFAIEAHPCNLGAAQVAIAATVKPRHGLTPLNILSSSLTFPGWFRTLGFLEVIHDADSRGYTCEGCLGHAIPLAPLLPDDPRILTLHVPSLHSDTEARTWLADTLKLVQANTLGAQR